PTSTSGGRGPFARHYANDGSPMGLLSGGGSRGSSDGAGTSAYMTAADKYDNTNIGILPPLPFPLPVPSRDGAPGNGSAVHGLGYLTDDGDGVAAANVMALPDTASVAGGDSGRLMATVAAGGGLSSSGHGDVVGGGKTSWWEIEQLGHDHHHYPHPLQRHPHHSQHPLTPPLLEDQDAQRHLYPPGLQQPEKEPYRIDPWVSRKDKAQEVDPSWQSGDDPAKINDDTPASANAVVQQVVLGRRGDVRGAVVADATLGNGGAAMLSQADLPRLSLPPPPPPSSLPAQAQQPARRRHWVSDRPTGRARKMEKPYDLGTVNESTGAAAVATVTATAADMATARLRRRHEHQRRGSPDPP
ncbi:hypothetical protein Vafri_9435, partial [Volvox africanus]